MGWVLIGKNRYYYRVVWNGHRQVTIYCGAGRRGEAAAAEDAEYAAARRAMWARHAAQRALAAQVEAAAAPAAGLTDALMVASLLTKGLHHSMSNGWRRQRRR
jgi:hypothetical protein